MFRYSDTMHEVLAMRRQEDLQYAARQRLAATAMTATENRRAHLAGRDRLLRVLHTVGALLRIGTRLPHLPSSPIAQGR